MSKKVIEAIKSIDYFIELQIWGISFIYGSKLEKLQTKITDTRIIICFYENETFTKIEIDTDEKNNFVNDYHLKYQFVRKDYSKTYKLSNKSELQNRIKDLVDSLNENKK